MRRTSASPLRIVPPLAVPLLAALLLLLPPPVAALESIVRVDLSGADAALAPLLAPEDGAATPDWRRRLAAPWRLFAGASGRGPVRLALVNLAPDDGEAFPYHPVPCIAFAAPPPRTAAEEFGWNPLAAGGLHILHPAHPAAARQAFASAAATLRPAAPPPGAFAAGMIDLRAVPRILRHLRDGRAKDAAAIEPPCLVRMRRHALLVDSGKGERVGREIALLEGRCPESDARYEARERNGRRRLVCPVHGTEDSFDRAGFVPLDLFRDELLALDTVAALWDAVGPLSFTVAAANEALTLRAELPISLPAMRRTVFLKGGGDPFALLAGGTLDRELVATIPDDAAPFAALRLPRVTPALRSALAPLLADAERLFRGGELGRLILRLLPDEATGTPGGLPAALAPGIAWVETRDDSGNPGSGLLLVRIADPAALPGLARTLDAWAAEEGLLPAERFGYRFHAAPADSRTHGIRELALFDDRLVVSFAGGGTERIARVLVGESPARNDAEELAACTFACEFPDAGPFIDAVTHGTYAAWDRPVALRMRRAGDTLVATATLGKGGEAR